MTPLDTDVRYIKGIGEARAKSLVKLGINTLQDLVKAFPRAYDDRTVFKRIDELIVGESVCVRAMVASRPTLSRIRRGLDIVKLRAVDDRGTMNITYFNQSYMADNLHAGEEYVFYGRVGGKIGMPEMVNPVFEKASSEGISTGRIMPLYHLTSGLSQNMMSKAIRQGLDACGDVLPDPLPVSVREAEKLSQSRYAYENIHFPQSFEALEIARRRLIFEEFFVLSCALDMFRRDRAVKAGIKMQSADLNEFYSSLPFELTGAQKRAIEEAVSDMCSGEPMSRLVQGDVGSGKTVVAAACCWYAFRSGYQSAFMAPTEILADQHYKTLSELLGKLGMRLELITGGMGAKARREALERIKSGESDLMIGTHALISDTVEYARLGLVVADEQHRFGVQQRAALADKGDSPHILVMSATPIPRTLALIVYGDLDVSVIDELPPGRQKVDTFSVGENMRERIYAFIRKLVGEGRQVFIVCPAVEENEEQNDGLKAVKMYAKELSEKVFPELSVALVHGKMKAKEKNETMASFAAGNIDILVATTVIEVGVDVPNAALMVVENADRFGLSQLHQLRGRVGRGKHQSYCIMFEGAGGETAKERLKAMCATNDGFRIAEEDLRLRGPGDFFGSRQHGLPEMRVANFASDVDVLKRAQTEAREVIEKDPELELPENAELKKSVSELIARGETTLN